jgi:hypothetical protein
VNVGRALLHLLLLHQLTERMGQQLLLVLVVV